MTIYQRIRVISLIFMSFSNFETAFAAKKVGMKHEGITQLAGSVIAAPCSIVMNNRYQTVNFTPLALNRLSTKAQREQHTHPFEIELRDCGSVYSNIDSKTWTIRFDGKSTENIEAFALQGPSQGLGVSVLDSEKKILTPGKNYSLFNSELRSDSAGDTLFLRYFMQLELTGMPIQAGDYQGLVSFFIDYQ